MIRRIAVAAATLSLIACASSTESPTDSTSNLTAGGDVPVSIIVRASQGLASNDAALVAAVRSQIDLTAFREARIEEFADGNGAEHLVVQLLVKNQHRLELARIDLDASLAVTGVSRNYRRLASERAASSSPSTTPTYHCPDESVQFIALCPNNDQLEIDTTNDVANAAIAAGLKTVTLLKSKATHDAYMNYMTCPKLVGNFYDGDSNPDEMVTYNGQITASEIAASQHWNHAVTTIWVACEAYNDPMLSAVQKSAQAQKYAAGINDLEVGPSDKAAACAMKAAIAGKPETQSFHDCYAQLNTTADQWGFGGDGADVFASTLPPASSSSGGN